MTDLAKIQCLETQTPVSMPLPCDKSQKQPPGQLSFGAIQVVPHAAAFVFTLSAFTDITPVARVAVMKAMVKSFFICAPFTIAVYCHRIFKRQFYDVTNVLPASSRVINRSALSQNGTSGRKYPKGICVYSIFVTSIVCTFCDHTIFAIAAIPIPITRSPLRSLHPLQFTAVRFQRFRAITAMLLAYNRITERNPSWVVLAPVFPG
jgi:hypothetical protein